MRAWEIASAGARLEQSDSKPLDNLRKSLEIKSLQAYSKIREGTTSCLLRTLLSRLFSIFTPLTCRFKDYLLDPNRTHGQLCYCVLQSPNPEAHDQTDGSSSNNLTTVIPLSCAFHDGYPTFYNSMPPPVTVSHRS